MQRNEAEAFAAAALERFRYLHLYAERKLIEQGRFVEAARRLLRRTRNGLISSTLLGAWMIWSAIDHVPLGDELAARFGSPAGASQAINVATTALIALFGLSFVAGAAWTHGRMGELLRLLETVLPEQAPQPGLATAS